VKLAKPLLLSLLAVVLVLAAAGAALAQDEEKIVLTVGTDDVDTFNPLVGVEVPDYEAWNLQYATLTDKAAADFAIEPGLAESWEASNDGKTYTYTLREGLTWSDGEPLTADDVVFTVNTSREEEWLNYTSTTQNLTARAIDDRTVEIASSVPDPKLPSMDVYILPEHVWGELDQAARPKYEARDGVGSGPFTLAEYKSGQFWRMAANASYWKGEPAVDEVVFRVFNNADAMVAALKSGEIDAAQDVPSASFAGLQTTEGIVAIEGQQGNVDEVSVNGGRPEKYRVEGIGNGHPALSDIEFRKAIAHAIDDQTIIDRVDAGIGEPALMISPSPDVEWQLDVPVEEQFTFDLDRAQQILEDAGYKDTNGNGTREMPGGGDEINLVFAVRSDSQIAPPIAEFVKGWLEDIGIGVTLKPMNESQLTVEIGKGNYDLFHWSWTPFVDPDPMLSYFTCDQLSVDPDNPTNYYNDANWCDEEYDRLYKEQNQELDRAKRVELVHEMLRIFYDSATYNNIAQNPDLQAYRTDRFEGWLRQPADVGPVIFSNTSPTYANLTPIEGGGDDGGISTAAIVAIALAGAGLIAVLGVYFARRRTAEERE
jgi:peptide/nickel transport system substrate-binding protein